MLSNAHLFMLLTVGLPASFCAADGAVSEDDAPPRLDLRAGTITVDVKAQPLARVVAALNQLKPDGCTFSGTVFQRSDSPVTVSYRDLPVRDGLRRLLRGHDYLLRCDPDPANSVAVNLLQRRDGEAAAASAERSAPEADLAQLDALFDSGTIDDLTVALAAASDHPASEVRQKALRLLSQMGEQSVVGLADDIATHDPDPALRIQALEVIADQRGGAAVELLSSFINDDNNDVRRRAAELLAQVEQR